MEDWYILLCVSSLNKDIIIIIIISIISSPEPKAHR